VTFAPSETKRHAFDFAVGSDFASLRLRPGTYLLTGAYRDHWSKQDTVNIRD
jgi:hypothetical protein